MISILFDAAVIAGPLYILARHNATVSLLQQRNRRQPKGGSQ